MITIFSLRSGKIVRNAVSTDGEAMRGRGWTDCPDDFERMRWDRATRRWIADAGVAADVDRRRIDGAYCADHGEGAKREAHHRKAIEAHLYLALGDQRVAPMLAAESVATGMELAALAAVVAAKDREWIAREVARRTAKTERNI